MSSRARLPLTTHTVPTPSSWSDPTTPPSPPVLTNRSPPYSTLTVSAGFSAAPKPVSPTAARHPAPSAGLPSPRAGRGRGGGGSPGRCPANHAPAGRLSANRRRRRGARRRPCRRSQRAVLFGGRSPVIGAPRSRYKQSRSRQMMGRRLLSEIWADARHVSTGGHSRHGRPQPTHNGDLNRTGGAR